MDKQRTPAATAAGLDPDEIGRKSFETAFRGFDPSQVQGYLLEVAAELRRSLDREFELQLRVGEAEQAAAEAAQIDEGRLTATLGTEVASIFDAARDAAAKITAKAERRSAELVRDGEAQAAALRTEAEGLLGTRRQEAETAAAAIRTEADQVLADARQAAADEIKSGKQEGRQMVAEAQLVRERILKDLARRRRTARQQIEQLRAGRERLLEAFRVVRETTAQATEELEISLPAAKAAAETAGRGDDDEDLSLEQLERMLDSARDAGLVEVAADEEATPPEVPTEAEVGQVEVAEVDVDVEADEPEEAGDEPPRPPSGTDGDIDDAPGEEVAVADEPPPPDDLAEKRSRRRRGRKTDGVVATDDPAPPPVAGRRSSSVRVFRRDGDPGSDEPTEVSVDPVAEEAVPAEPAQVADAEPEAPSTPGPVAPVADGPHAEEIAETVDPADTAPASSKAEGGEVITGLFARIRADHDPADSTPSTADAADEGRTKPGNGKPGNGKPANGKPGNGKAAKGKATNGKRGNGKATNGKTTNGKRGNGKASNGKPGSGRSRPATAAAEPRPAAEETDDEQTSEVESPVAQRDRTLSGPARALGRALKRVLADEQNELLDSVRKERKVGEADDLLAEESEHAVRFAASARPDLADAAYAGATMVDAGTEERPDIDDLAAELALAVVSPLRREIGQAFEAGSGDRDAVLDGLRESYRRTKNDRIDECVSHYAGEAFNRGVRAASRGGPDASLLVDAGAKPSMG